MNFISRNYPYVFATYTNFDECKKLKHRLVMHEQWSYITAYMNNRCVFTDTSLDHSNAIRVMFHIAEAAPTSHL